MSPTIRVVLAFLIGGGFFFCGAGLYNALSTPQYVGNDFQLSAASFNVSTTTHVVAWSQKLFQLENGGEKVTALPVEQPNLCGQAECYVYDGSIPGGMWKSTDGTVVLRFRSVNDAPISVVKLPQPSFFEVAFPIFACLILVVVIIFLPDMAKKK